MASPVTWYCNWLTGDDLNSGTSRADAFKTLAAALAAAAGSASGNEVIELEGGSGQVYEQASSDSSSIVGLTIQARDSTGVISTANIQGFNRGDAPSIKALTSGSQLSLSGSATLVCSGVVWDGNSVASEALGYTSNLTVELVDCRFHSHTTRGTRIRTNGVIRRCIFHDEVVGLQPVTAAEIHMCAFTRISSWAIDRWSSGTADLVTNCSIWDCDTGGTKAYPIDSPGGNLTVHNLILLDNGSDYGALATHNDHCSAYTSDGASYHTLGNWDGTPNGTTQLETNPGYASSTPLVGTPSPADFYLPAGSALGPGIGYATTEAYYLDGTPVTNAAAPGFGCCPIGVGEVEAIVRGTHEIKVYGSKDFEAEHPSVAGWTLTGGQAHLAPLIARATLDASDELTIRTDRPLQYGVTYTLATPYPLTGDTEAPESVAVVGKRVDLGSASTPQEEILADYLAPMVNKDGTGGRFITSDAGDFIIRGGLESLMGVLWHRVLTRLGELYYAPREGVDLRPKGLTPVNLAREQRRLKAELEAVPYVNQAQVVMRAEQHTLTVTLRVDTDLGATSQTRSMK